MEIALILLKGETAHFRLGDFASSGLLAHANRFGVEAGTKWDYDT